MTNLSTRRKLAGGDTVIAGFVVNGESPREILLRAVGGSLGAFGVPEVMPDPRLTLYAADGSELGGSAVAGDDEETLAVTTAVGAFGLTDQKDAVLLQTLNPGAYTVHVGAADGRGGEVLTEVYDVTGRSTNGPAEDYRSKAVNLSTRAVLAAEDSLIVGFVVGSDRERTLVLRGIGPTLEAFGVAGALEDPEVEIFNANGEAVALNQDWATTAELEAAMQAAGAFAPLSEREAITMLSLPPGAYTMHVRATSGTAGGDVIAEIYDVTDAGF
jgi:hypothetical protein